jgi:hypothetical protein
MIVSRVYVVQLAAKDSSTKEDKGNIRCIFHLVAFSFWEVGVFDRMVGAFHPGPVTMKVVMISSATTCIIPKFQSFLSIFFFALLCAHWPGLALALAIVTVVCMCN